MKKFVFSIIGLLLLSIQPVSTYAQDPHFSQYFFSPLTLNPAMTGLFNGNYRFTGIYRSQWQSVIQDKSNDYHFSTFSGSFDLRTMRGFDRKDAIGIGIVGMRDVAGAARFGSSTLAASLAYHKSLSRSANHFLSAGIFAGATQRTIDYTRLRFGSQFDGEKYNELLLSGENFSDNSFMFADVGAGLMWYYVANSRSNYFLGFSAYHLNAPDQSFYGTSDVRLFRKFSVNAGLQLPVGQQADLIPSVFVMKQGPAFESIAGSYVKFFFDQRDPLGSAFYVGPFYRVVGGNPDITGTVNSESLILATRLDYMHFSLGFSYDLNFSDLTRASSARGGFEVALSYVGSFSQRGPGVIFCPRF